MLASGLGQRAGTRCPTPCTSSRNVRVHSVFSAKGAAQEARVVGREWLETILSRFGPATDRAQNITTLDFEKPLLELDKRIKEVGVICSIACCNPASVGCCRRFKRALCMHHRSAKLQRRMASTSAPRLLSWRRGHSRYCCQACWLKLCHLLNHAMLSLKPKAFTACTCNCSAEQAAAPVG